LESFWTRNEILIGSKGRARLSAARIAVIGTGGVGSFAVEALARAGIGYLELVDPDVYVPSNLNRQLGALHSTLGHPKVKILAARCRDINKEIIVNERFEAYTPSAGSDFIRPDLDYLIDAIDSVDDKIDLLARAVKAGLPVVSSMGMARRLDPAALKVADISQTKGCPLARAVRKGLKERGIIKGLTVVYSEEILRAGYKSSGNERVLGSMVFVPASAGLLLASIVVRELLAKNSC